MCVFFFCFFVFHWYSVFIVASCEFFIWKENLNLIYLCFVCSKLIIDSYSTPTWPLLSSITQLQLQTQTPKLKIGFSKPIKPIPLPHSSPPAPSQTENRVFKPFIVTRPSRLRRNSVMAEFESTQPSFRTLGVLWDHLLGGSLHCFGLLISKAS